MSEFKHYSGCKNNDLDNCSACALLNAGPEGPNYAGWPISFLLNQGKIPKKYMNALKNELNRNDNKAYIKNLESKLIEYGYNLEDLKKE